VRDRVNNRVDGINARAVMSDDRKVTITGRGKAGEHPLSFEIGAIAPAHPGERQNIPVELKLEAPGALQAPLSAKAEVRLNGPVVMINGVSGTLGDGAFNGWASADLSSKPLVKLDLDFKRLDIAASAKSDAPSAQGLQHSWSNVTIDLTGLNYVDAQARISAAEINIGEAHFAPAAIDAELAGGVLKARFANLGAYGGQASGDLIVDASPACAPCPCCEVRPISTSSTASCRRSWRCVRPATASAPSCPISTAPCSRCSRTARSAASTSRR
jgi:AsmA protein